MLLFTRFLQEYDSTVYHSFCRQLYCILADCLYRSSHCDGSGSISLTFCIRLMSTPRRPLLFALGHGTGHQQHHHCDPSISCCPCQTYRHRILPKVSASGLSFGSWCGPVLLLCIARFCFWSCLCPHSSSSSSFFPSSLYSSPASSRSYLKVTINQHIDRLVFGSLPSFLCTIPTLSVLWSHHKKQTVCLENEGIV